MPETARHFVAIIGGGIAGSVAAEILAERGTRVVVIEQNRRPYGKIEDGLPRWHAEQRKMEYGRIDARMKKPGVSFLPCTKLGRDIDFADLCNGWGFSAVILANGAWRDRPIGIPGAEEFLGKGLVYQNSLIYWYNHRDEPGYSGPRYTSPDEALVVGGGLASIDVVKILQLDNYERALKARGIPVTMRELESKGIPAICKLHGVRPDELGVKGCLLIYRRRVQDMPLAQPPENASHEQIAKTEAVRQKMLNLARDKFLFRFQERRAAVGLIVEDGRLAGLKLAETRIEGGRAEVMPETAYEQRAPLVVSSIGSVPEPIPGVTMKGEYYSFTGEAVPQYTACDRVFGVGNVVTGKGNIRASQVHSQEVTTRLVENYIGVGGAEADYAALYAAAERRGAEQAKAVQERVEALPPLSDDEIAAIENRIRALQERAGYRGDYAEWIARHSPAEHE